jgi:low temperature requirement protein LtrA
MASLRIRFSPVSEGAKVTPLELYFDLVFVFALTQVTTLMAADLSPHGVVRGLLVLAVLWWGWVGYSWLGNVVRADEGFGRVAMFVAMLALFVIALTIPESFDDLPGGLPGPLVFVLCSLVVRAVHLVIFWLAAEDDPALRRQVGRFGIAVAAGTLFLLAASQASGAAQTALWGAAVLADYGGTLAAGTEWRLSSAAHFAERHGLIIIIALGESIIAIGVGVSDDPISWAIIAGSALGLAVTAALWWAYFDVVALVGERVLTRARGTHRIRIARESYSYLHLPMLMGIILLALGLKKALQYVADHDLSDSLHGLGLYCLYGGPALYLAGLVAFRMRNIGKVNVQRLGVALLLVALMPLGDRLPAIASLGLLVGLMVGLITFEALHFSTVRERVRHAEEIAVSELGRREPAAPSS